MDRILPEPISHALLGLGTWVAVFVMPRQRRCSLAYLATVLPRRPNLLHVWRHFFAYTHVLIARIRAADTGDHHCSPQPNFAEFSRLMHSGRPALLGTFHFGNSDLLGFLLGVFRRHVYMIRLRVDNSRDTHHLAETFGEWVTYIWVNQSENLLFALKHAAQSGGTIAMMCDRTEHSSKLEPFEFLGARRLMPFTIYHLSLVFGLPVVFCLSVPGRRGESLLQGSPVFAPDATLSKEENLERAREHYQAFLRQLEALLRANPYLWFNFLPLSPALPEEKQSPAPSLRAAPASC